MCVCVRACACASACVHFFLPHAATHKHTLSLSRQTLSLGLANTFAIVRLRARTLSNPPSPNTPPPSNLSVFRTLFLALLGSRFRPFALSLLPFR